MSFNSIACLALTLYCTLAVELYWDKEKNPKEYALFFIFAVLSFLLFFISFFTC